MLWIFNSVLKIVVANRTTALTSYGIRVLCCYQDLHISAVHILPTFGKD
jgi:hypothetical protein